MMENPRPLARLAASMLAMLLLVAACAGSGSVPPQASTVTAPPPSPPGTPASAETPAASVTSPISLTQPWATAPLIDVATGENFRIADLAGKVVILETMAIWCTNCRSQQADVQIALDALPPDGVVYVVLDVDPNEDATSLAEYQVDNGFEGRYAIAGADVARALAAEFGDQMLNPPSTPMLIIGTDGTVTRTEFGPKSADELVSLAATHGA